METPVVRLSDRETQAIYEPSEDSFLMIDALEIDLARLKKTKPSLCLEVGSGSGVISTALALASKRSWPFYCLAIDINPEACRITKRTGEENSIDLEVVLMDLATGISMRNIFDLVVFNPPYVATSSEEIEDEKMIARAWAGGEKGREVMDRLFPHIPKILSDSGVFYLLASKENEPREILDVFEKLEMVGEIVDERRIRGEHLYAMRFAKRRGAEGET